MEKNLPVELDREILMQLAPEQLVEIIVEQAIARSADAKGVSPLLN